MQNITRCTTASTLTTITATSSGLIAIKQNPKYARLALDGEMQAWVDAEDSLDVW